MFKLIKILGAKNNIPELEKFTTDGCFSPIEEGAAMERAELTLGEAELNAQYIIGKDNPSKKDYMLAYRVTPDMIFKVNYVGDEAPEVGLFVKPCKLGRAMHAVTQADDGYGRIIAVCDNPEYVYVKFDKIMKECEC